MTDKTRVIGARVANEIADWMEERGLTARDAVEAYYEGQVLDLTEFKAACDRLRIDYQMAVDRMAEEINSIPGRKTRKRG